MLHHAILQDIEYRPQIISCVKFLALNFGMKMDYNVMLHLIIGEVLECQLLFTVVQIHLLICHIEIAITMLLFFSLVVIMVSVRGLLLYNIVIMKEGVRAK